MHTPKSQVDEVLALAASVSSNLMEQRRMFDNVTDTILSVGARFPVVNAVRRKKSKDTIVLSAVIGGCLLFTIIYMFNK